MSAANPFKHRRSFLTCAVAVVAAPALAGPAPRAQNKDYLN